VLKIIDGNGRSYNDAGFDSRSAVALFGERIDKFRVRAYDLGNGHIEAVASRVIQWHEAEWSHQYLLDTIAAIERAREEADEEETRAKNRERAARRARTRVRRLCKAMGADTLLTLTYKALVDDLDVCKRHLKEFHRRMQRLLPGFALVACFELQKRGAWHVHMATAGIPRDFVRFNQTGQAYRVKSFDAIRAVWRSVTGELGGNIDVSRRKRNSQRGPARIAAYIAKYIGKAFAEGEMDEGKNRWTKFGDCGRPPEAVDLGIVDSLMEAIGLTYGLLCDDQQVSTARLDHWKEWFFVAGERPPPRRVKAPIAA
jgi:hypothetical protein